MPVPVKGCGGSIEKSVGLPHFLTQNVYSKYWYFTIILLFYIFKLD